VAHHVARCQAVPDGEAAEDRLGHDSEREQHAEDREIAPERPAEEREQARRGGREADEARQHPVAELDQRVAVRLGDEAPVLVAVGP
jgi:hypothetical protein